MDTGLGLEAERCDVQPGLSCSRSQAWACPWAATHHFEEFSASQNCPLSTGQTQPAELTLGSGLQRDRAVLGTSSLSLPSAFHLGCIPSLQYSPGKVGRCLYHTALAFWLASHREATDQTFKSTKNPKQNSNTWTASKCLNQGHKEICGKSGNET